MIPGNETRAFMRKSCPDFSSVAGMVRELSDNSASEVEQADSGARRKEDPVTTWLEEHIEMVGSPRPFRLPRGEDCTEDVREDAIRKVAFMADRYKAQLEEQKQQVRRAVSAPDLSKTLQAASEQEAVAMSTLPPSSPSSPSRCPAACAPCCASLDKMQDAVRRMVGRPTGPAASPQGKGGTSFDSPENSVIIFDWDDTLLPTTYILQTVLPSLPETERCAPLPPSSIYYEELAAHAHIVEFMLRTARRVARVAVVTNSLNPWVVASATRYLPGLDMEALMEELQIPVFYARRHIEALAKTVTYHEECFEIQLDHSTNSKIGMDIIPSDKAIRIAKINDGGLVGQWNQSNPLVQVLPGDLIYEVNGRSEELAKECRKPTMLDIKLKRDVPDRDPFMEAKRIDMDTCMSIFYPSQDGRRNVLSIGDSVAEQIAVKEVLPRTGNVATESLCKTVALLPRPTVHQLSNELKVLGVWLSYMVRYGKDFDLAMDRLDRLEKELFQMK
mmetsp:Transcript_20267/g.44252  ORF Transcript_20267/g.44252 Transcript_20267/m.44252 type:complete len:502 (-) Transcript_20267:48-1553(-)